MAFWHGRILPATVHFRAAASSSSSARTSTASGLPGIIKRFGYGTARGSTSRGALRALLQLKRDLAAGTHGRVRGRRPARPGARRAAGRRLAREGHRSPRSSVSSRSRSPLDAQELGPHADSKAVQHGRTRGRRADVGVRRGNRRRRERGVPNARSTARRARGAGAGAHPLSRWCHALTRLRECRPFRNQPARFRVPGLELDPGTPVAPFGACGRFQPRSPGS